MAFTEFYCQSGGSNLNAGSTTNNTAPYTSTNGNWSTVTNVFTPTDGSTPASSIAAGDFVSIYLDAATTAVYIARVTVVAAGVNGGITVSSSIKAGTAPATSATGRSLKAGGAWKGPSGADGGPAFKPFSGGIGGLAPTSTDVVRINCKNDATYSVTAALAPTGSTTVFYQGYTSTPGDLGKAIIDGGTSGASYVLLSPASGGAMYDFEFRNNGSTGSADGVQSASNGLIVARCIFHDFKGTGLFCNGTTVVVECEAYACNTSNSRPGAFVAANAEQVDFWNCIAHDNTGNANDGFSLQGGNHAYNCVSESNGRHGFAINATASPRQQNCLFNCDSYNNAGDGIKSLSSSAQDCSVVIRNCNLIKNTGFGINGGSTRILTGLIDKNGFGSGTQVNGSGNYNAIGFSQDSLGNNPPNNDITYASGVTPWVDPANGDFRINLAAAKNAGRGAFLETATSYAGTIAYPDIGAAQHYDTQKSHVLGG